MGKISKTLFVDELSQTIGFIPITKNIEARCGVDGIKYYILSKYTSMNKWLNATVEATEEILEPLYDELDEEEMEEILSSIMYLVYDCKQWHFVVFNLSKEGYSDFIQMYGIESYISTHVFDGIDCIISFREDVSYILLKYAIFMEYVN